MDYGHLYILAQTLHVPSILVRLRNPVGRPSTTPRTPLRLRTSSPEHFLSILGPRGYSALPSRNTKR